MDWELDTYAFLYCDLRTSAVREAELVQMHWDLQKLLELGVDEKFLKECHVTPEQARDLVKGLLYLRERYGDTL